MAICGSQSKEDRISTGVPQGSILGAFSFLVYINDLASYAQNNNKIAILADDTSILKLLLQPDLDKISTWFSFNKLSPNTSKGEVMNFSLGNRTKVIDFTGTEASNKGFG